MAPFEPHSDRLEPYLELGEHKIDYLLKHLNSLVDASGKHSPLAGRAVDVIVTPVEVNDNHGTGVFLKMLFAAGDDIVSIRSLDQHNGQQDFGLPMKIVHGLNLQNPDLQNGVSREAIFTRISNALRGVEVRRILCVPYLPDDVMTAIAIHGIFKAPMCTFIMDDQNIAERSIADGPMRELLEKSTLRLAISPEMRGAYERKFGLPFFYLPPTAPADMMPSQLHVPVTPPDARHGVVIGNLWSPRWPDLLRRTIRHSGATLSYPGGNSLPGSAESWQADGIYPQERLASDELVRMLRSMWFAVLPSGTMDAEEDRRWVAEFSLPSRLVYLMCTSHIPVIVLGSRDTAAAHFVEQFGIGVVADYDRDSFRNAVQHISQPDVNLAMRRRGYVAAGRFVDTGIGEWIWQSLAKGEALDRRFEDLAPSRDVSYSDHAGHVDRASQTGGR